MQGLAAIAAHNGWAMAATGACIVIAGLAVLSIIISQLHRIIGFFEKKEKPEQPEAEKTEPIPPVELKSAEIDPLSDLQETAKILKPFTEDLGETFKMAELYKALEAANIPHPHITIRELKAAGYLASGEEGSFSWSNV